METILIQNFKAIKNTAKREIKIANLTILMGEQATGKSTVAKLVYFFKKLPEEMGFELLNNSEINSENFEKELDGIARRFFETLFDFHTIRDNFIITYRYENNFYLRIHSDSRKGELYIKWPTENFIMSIKDSWIPYNIVSTKLKNGYNQESYVNEDRLSIQLFKKTIGSFGSNQRAVYFPASRNIVVSMENYLIDIFSKFDGNNRNNRHFYVSENDFIIRNFIKHIQIIKNRFRRGGFYEIIDSEKIERSDSDIFKEFIKWVEEILVGVYNYSDSEEKLYSTSLKDYVFLENASSGQQESVRIIQDIFLEVLDARPTFRVYEEPESHLSPVGQLGIIQLIAMLANRNPDNQIIIPTHTPYLLYEISNMLKASAIVKSNPELKDEVSKILKPYYWLDLESVSAYQLNRDGEIEDAKDLEYQMIDGELFDRVTNETSDQFDKLLKLQGT